MSLFSLQFIYVVIFMAGASMYNTIIHAIVLIDLEKCTLILKEVPLCVVIGV